MHSGVLSFMGAPFCYICSTTKYLQLVSRIMISPVVNTDPWDFSSQSLNVDISCPCFTIASARVSCFHLNVEIDGLGGYSHLLHARSVTKRFRIGPSVSARSRTIFLFFFLFLSISAPFFLSYSLCFIRIAHSFYLFSFISSSLAHFDSLSLSSVWDTSRADPRACNGYRLLLHLSCSWYFCTLKKRSSFFFSQVDIARRSSSIAASFCLCCARRWFCLRLRAFEWKYENKDRVYSYEKHHEIFVYPGLLILTSNRTIFG